MKRQTGLVWLMTIAVCTPIAVADVEGTKVDGGVFRKFVAAVDFSPRLSDLLSSSDLLNGFTVNDDDNCGGGACVVGLPINQGINESAIAPYILGWVDPYNGPDFNMLDPNALPGIGSYLMTNDACRRILYEQVSNGFYYPPLAGQGGVADLVDGVAGDQIKSVLRDYARASLVVRFGFQNPTDIGRLRVFAANLTLPGNAGRDGRVWQYYDVYARSGDCSGGACPAGPGSTDGFDEFYLVAEHVTSGEPGQMSNNPGTNPTPFEGTMTDIVNFNGDVLIEGATDLRIVFYCVSNADGFFIDPWQGYVNDDPAASDACSNSVLEESPVVPSEDGYRKAFQASIIKEIDAFGPIATPVADIDYDNDIDLKDMAAMQRCFNNDVTTNGCYRYDVDTNGVFDVADYTQITPQITGPLP